jgi:predicted dehydrogenase
MPRAVTASGGRYELQGRITTPDVLQVWFEFDQCPVTWNHRIFPAATFTPETNIGMSFYGEKESVFLNDRRYVVAPAEKGAERRVVEGKGDAQAAHVGEWLAAVRGGGTVSCPPADAFQSTAAVQLAMIALESGGRVEWDDATQGIRGNPKAAALLKRDYRGPWVHPWKG